MVSSMLPLLALAATAAALQVTSPAKNDVWTTGASQEITWDVVSSDQDSFNIYLSNMASYPTTTILLASDVDSSTGSYTIDGTALTTGNDFTINFTNGTETEQIYAQSNQFDITAGTSSSSSSSSAAATATSSSSSGTASSSITTATATAPSAAATTTTTSSANSTKTGSSTASATDSSSTAASTSDAATTTGSSSASTTTAATAGAGKVVAGWAGVLAVAAMVL